MSGKEFRPMVSTVPRFLNWTVIFLMFSSFLCAQTGRTPNEKAVGSAEAERKIMEETLQEVVKLAGGPDSARGKMFQKSQNEWIQYVKEQAKADADGVSGKSQYPKSYFLTMQELTRYRIRVLEGCAIRLKAEGLGGRADGAGSVANSQHDSSGAGAVAWREAIGDSPITTEVSLYDGQFEDVSGLLAGQWLDDKMWRGVFLAERGDSIILYGGKMERGGVVFEAWQEGARVGRGFVREETGNLRGRFFDERRRETAVVFKLNKRPGPQGQVGLTSYSGLQGTKEIQLGLEWHNATRYLRGVVGTNALVGHNYAGGKIFLVERTGSLGGPAIAFWALAKKTAGGKTRWVGTRNSLSGELDKIDIGG